MLMAFASLGKPPISRSRVRPVSGGADRQGRSQLRLGLIFQRAREPQMYANILLSTDGSDVAGKGVKHGIALAKALNAKVTVITVTEALPVDYGSGHASAWIPSQEEFDRFDAACKERAGEVLDEARAMADQ